MYYQDRGGQVVSRPTPNPVIGGGWANNDLTETTAQTIMDPDWVNGITAELVNILTAANLTPSKTNVSQVLAALGILFGRHGYCRLSVSSATQLLLKPYNGNGIIIAGAPFQIPSGGITAGNTATYVNGVAGQNLAANTLYYVYVFNNAGTLTLDFSTTGHATDTSAGNVGVEIKSGDSSRTLVGMVYTTASSQFADSATQMYCVNWFHRRSKVISTSYTSVTTSSGSGSPTDLGSAHPLQFISWSDEAISVETEAATSTSAGGSTNTTAVGIDGGVVGSGTSQTVTTGGVGAAIASYQGAVSEGFHSATTMGYVSGGTGTWNSVFISTLVRG